MKYETDRDGSNGDFLDRNISSTNGPISEL